MILIQKSVPTSLKGQFEVVIYKSYFGLCFSDKFAPLFNKEDWKVCKVLKIILKSREVTLPAFLFILKDVFCDEGIYRLFKLGYQLEPFVHTMYLPERSFLRLGSGVNSSVVSFDLMEAKFTSKRATQAVD